MCKISIIVPFLNSQNTLRRCIESILSQTHILFELLLVNDGSTDDSKIVCLEYVKKDSRVYYFEQKNQGASKARNKGILEAKGDYVCFIDSDDYVTSTYIEDFLDFSKNDPYDIVFQGLFHVEKNKVRINKHISSGTFKGSNVIDAIYYLEKNDNFGYTPIKLFDRRILIREKINFRDDLVISEDLDFTLRYCLHIRNLKIADRYNYFYVKDNNSSLSKKEHSFNQLTLRNTELKKYSIALLEKHSKENSPYKDYINRRFCSGTIQAIVAMYLEEDKYKKTIRIREISNIKTQMKFNMLFSRDLDFRFTFIHMIFALFPSHLVDLLLSFIYRRQL